MLITKKGIQVKNTSYKDAIELLTNIRPIAVTENLGIISFIDKSWNHYDINIVRKPHLQEDNIDENAETLEDKLRMEHTPTLEELEQLNVPEEREDINLFEAMAEKFKPKQKETNEKSKVSTKNTRT